MESTSQKKKRPAHDLKCVTFNPHPTRALRWYSPDFNSIIAENWPCPYCGGKLRASDVEFDNPTITLTCNRCHARPLQVELHIDSEGAA